MVPGHRGSRRPGIEACGCAGCDDHRNPALDHNSCRTRAAHWWAQTPLITAEVIAELADSARLQPLIHPLDASPERGYTPSSALADFVRCRDLTCRFPGCDAQPWIAMSTTQSRTLPAEPPGHGHHPCLQPQLPVPETSWGQDVLGLARQTATRRHRDLDDARRAQLHHHAKQRSRLMRNRGVMAITLT